MSENLLMGKHYLKKNRVDQTSRYLRPKFELLLMEDDFVEVYKMKKIIDSYENTVHDIVCDSYDEFLIPGDDIFDFVSENMKVSRN